MLPSRHLALTTVVALPLAPIFGWQAAAFWGAAILVDADKYLWYVRRYWRLNPVAAYRQFRRTPPTRDEVWPIFHGWAFAGLLAAGAIGIPLLRPILAGVVFHHLLDDRGRLFIRLRGGFRCCRCGVRTWRVEIHKVPRATREGPAVRRRVPLCHPCHVRVHEEDRRAGRTGPPEPGIGGGLPEARP